MKKNSVSLPISGTVPHMIVVFGTCVKWWYLQQIFHFFKSLIFQGFSKFINKWQKEILRCAPPSPHRCQFFVKLWLIFPNWSYQGQDYLNVPEIVPQWKIVTIPIALFYPANMAWLFEKFIFEVEAFYSFKITCILVRQVISLKKNGSVISKIYCLILWSPICAPLILVSASVKMVGTSATVTCNSMRVDIPGGLFLKG